MNMRELYEKETGKEYVAYLLFDPRYVSWLEGRAAGGAQPPQATNNARDEMLPGCSGCKHIAHDQTLDTYPCRGCIRVRRTDLFDAGSTSPVA